MKLLPQKKPIQKNQLIPSSSASRRKKNKGPDSGYHPTITAPPPEQRGGMPARRWLQIGLGAFAVTAMLISFLIPRKKY